MSAPSDVPLREQSHFDLPQASQPEPISEDRLCPGCKKSAVNELGGLVVAFGSSFFHVDCFKCAKCRNQVNADTNLLLLSDGSPICANCSYSCNVCKQAILDEAIMAGDDAYHAHCFKCKVCKNRIDELVFAKTSAGIYCMKCHNERMIRIRKHTQKKAEREKAQGGSGSSKSRERDARNFHRDNQSTPTHDANAHKSSSMTQLQDDPSRRPQDYPRAPSRANSSQNVSQSSQSGPALTVSTPAYNHNISVTTSSPSASQQDFSSHSLNGHPSKQHTLPVPGPHPGLGGRPRSASYDEGWSPGAEPRNMSEFGLAPSSGAGGLSVATSRRDKRRSINPGLLLNPFPNGLPAETDSRPKSPTDQATRRTSHADSVHSLHSIASSQEVSRSSSPSITTRDYDQHDDTVVLRSPLSDPSNTIFPGGPHGERITAGLSPNDPRANFRSQQRSSSTSNLSTDSHRPGSRSASPAYRADVPHGVESGTDTDDDAKPTPHRNSVPPALPPKDGRAATFSPEPADTSEWQDPDSNGGRDDFSDAEAPRIERKAHSTYIAPALPPIRVSLTSDLSDFLNGKSISDLAALSDQPGVPTPMRSSQALPHIDEEMSSGPHTPTADDSSQGHGSSSSHAGRSDSSSSANGFKSSQSSTISQSTLVPHNLPRQKSSGADIVTTRLREALENAKERGAQQLKLDRAFVEAILGALDSRTADLGQMKAKFDGMRRASKQYIEGFNGAQTEYERELKLRRDAEAEVTRLRVLLSGQAARLTALTGDSKRQEVRQQMTKDLNDSLSGLESDLSRLKTERDMALAEMEELTATKSSVPEPAALSRTLTKRLDNIRNQYQRDLVPLQHQREQLNREIAELRAVRDVFLEETAALNARNEELAQLSAVYTRRMDTITEAPAPARNGNGEAKPYIANNNGPRYAGGQVPMQFAPSLSASTSSTSTVYEESAENRNVRHLRSDQDHTPAKNKFKWPGTKVKETASPMNGGGGVEFSKGKAHIEHNFQQISLLNFTRCKHCGDKMWGSQLRCTVCSTSIHVRCIANVQIPCTQAVAAVPQEPISSGPLPPSMFGRDMIEQIRAESKDGERRVPVIVEKCVDAVEALALDYEGIYRKTGGTGQTRTITQLFERGDYSSFDLLDQDRFTDICSITSVLKNYFRSLPTPLLTFDLYDQFIQSVKIRDPAVKHQTLVELVNQLPTEHYYTLRKLMVHLNHVRLQSEVNRMNARNLGVVFGPTLMRSRDPGAEFSDMAGKSLFIEWLIENAPEIFNDNS